MITLGRLLESDIVKKGDIQRTKLTMIIQITVTTMIGLPLLHQRNFRDTSTRSDSISGAL